MRAIAGGAAAYRVQLHAGFTFDAAAALAGYLADLGISHLYCSPSLQAEAGSAHGYDVVDPGRLNQELGGAAGYDRLVASLAEAGLGQLLDIVPNHMAVDGRANTWWWDVLENGPSSRYASYFDIDWTPPPRKLTAARPHPRSRRPLRPGAGGGRVAHPVPPGLLQRPVPRATRRPCRPGASTI